ncbi:MAG TPA: serine/threonine-protein kinase [Polyangiaceae bacterium]|nr:serine/threonine-protein kinase [Polyangiaceae bacterium]
MVAPVISAKLAPEPAPEPACGECLSDEDVLAFASGTLDTSRHLEAHEHFDQCEICQRLLSEAAHALATAVTIPDVEASELSWHTTFQPGTLVGHRYLIRHFIARGGMGEVYEAFDRELQERVALKTVTSTACDNAGAVRRLKAEVQLARRVSHPNVCRIYDFGTHVMPETGAPISFLTMEFADGETLGQRIRLGGALPIAHARRLGRDLLAGLSAAHEAGVLHRDFKSDNVMLRDNPDGDCSPLILDFGLARALDDGSRNHSASTPNLLGTFSYIAPEQLQGQPHTTASDVYSLGLVWFEMLTGELPFDSPSSPVGSALARLQSAPAAPSSKNPLVPSDLDTIVLRCLRRSPKDRYKTAREVLQALDAFEARARTVSLKRRLSPLCLGAILGGAAAYGAIIPPSHRAVVVTIRRSEPAASAPLPPPLIEPSSTTPIQSARVIPTPPAAPPERPAIVAPNARPRKPAAPVAPALPPPKPVVVASDPPVTNLPRVPEWENPFDEPTAAAAGSGH